MKRVQFVGFPDRNPTVHFDVRPPNETPGIFRLAGVYALPEHSALYRSDGSRIDESMSNHVGPGVHVHQADVAKFERVNDLLRPRQIDPARLKKARSIAGSTLHFGWFSDHYGHWLTEYTGRLWAHPRVSDQIARCFLPSNPALKAEVKPHIASMMMALGIPFGAAAPLLEPTCYEQLALPESAFQLRHRIFHCATDAHRRTAEALMPRATAVRRRPVYLSRAKLEKGLRLVAGEAETEQVFRARGFEIVHPELLPLADQIALFNSAPVIAGLMGSAFHTAMFSLPSYKGKLIVLAGNDPVNTRIIMHSQIAAYTLVFLYCYQFSVPEDRSSPPVVVIDPAAVAMELDKLSFSVQ